MATQKPEQFDQIDWDEQSTGGRFDLSINSKLMLVTGLPVILLWVYDYLFVPEREATFVKLGADLGLSSQFETLGLDYNPSSVDLLFLFTLFLFAWYILLPLYQNARMTRYYWREFRRNRPAVVSLVWLGIVFVGGTVGPFFIGQPEQNVLMANQPPVFLEVDMVHTPQCAGPVEGGACHGTWGHPLGTDSAGRDIFASVVHGMTVTMQIAFITTLIVTVIGVSVGTFSAFAGGWVDEILMRIVDIVLSFPTLLFFLLILYIYGAGLGMFILVFALFGWGSTARYVRSKALSVSEEEFIKATRISGASTYRILRRHVVPNTASSIITQLTLLVPGFLLAEAQLAYLGIGDTEVPTWGQLISSGRNAIDFAPWIVLVPGIALFLTILAFNFLGDALLDALNPEAQAESEQ
ncbi:ABC transporter permease [Halapricum desulfuricans]|uniref:ABC-type dipeptide/oligopeptide/nickel transportsystem, permease component n=1 Tax=Halapricum desulfuricans TaxID=2841257 RepID=A0A897N2W4_9EURY|nr:ABC transporter permease [Halapricum desulfuricans]QSG05449.1 ABC-type dipeptide/oligopeptide/nickel transportsystem, permease component [Halapricum desulfuricans]